MHTTSLLHYCDVFRLFSDSGSEYALVGDSVTKWSVGPDEFERTGCFHVYMRKLSGSVAASFGACSCDPIDWSSWHSRLDFERIMVGGSIPYNMHQDPVTYGSFTISGSNSWPGGNTPWIGA